MAGKPDEGTYPREMTFCGKDMKGDVVVPFVNVWPDYGDRTKSPVAAARHGTKGTLLAREGGRCKVEADGETGFVSWYFVEEFKDGSKRWT